MKTIAIVPIKKRSKRLRNKNFKKIGNKYLFEFILEKLKRCNFDEIYVDSDSKYLEK